MLAYLIVRNFALVSDLEMRFLGGLTVITGESGAGKSILLGALGLVLGQRVSKSQIRPGASECEVVAEFSLESAPKARSLLDLHGLNDQDAPNRCLVRRLASADGRSRAWINSTPVTLAVLRELCSMLVAIHTQFAQQQLMHNDMQLQWFNDFVARTGLINEVALHYKHWQKAKTAFETLKKQIEETNARRELLEYQVEELRVFDLQENEFEELSTQFKRLNQRQTLLTSVSQAIAALEEQATPSVGQTRTEIERLDDDSADLKAASELLNSVDIELEEALSYLRRFRDTLEQSDVSMEFVADRLDQLHDLARKHHVPSLDLFEKTKSLREELSQLEAGDEALEHSQKNAKRQYDAYLESARKLSKVRQAAADPFAKAVVKTLADIGMKNAQFRLGFSNNVSENGLESVEYLVSANPGYECAPLKRVASGGEISRISLALLAVVAARSKLPCLVLDEADVGVGGVSADELGRMLKRLAAHTQIVCVTHAPQVAALGDAHVRVMKTQNQDISVCELKNQSRIEEIARMVGGRQVNDESRKYASVLLTEAQSANQQSS